MKEMFYNLTVKITLDYLIIQCHFLNIDFLYLDTATTFF